MLSNYRVLDLTNERGYIGGRVFGDLGADVIKIEKPGGDPGRNTGPFYHDIPDPQKSLYWFAFNTNKRGITLDIETADGQNLFKKLVEKADVVIESFNPGYMEKLGLGYSALSQINSGLVMASISGFGQKGPYKDYKASDIVVSALGGQMYVTGDADKPPIVSSYPHAFLFAAMEAAAGSMIALFNRAITGRGQYVDCSAQLGILQTTGPEVEGLWQMEGIIFKRRGVNRWRLTTKSGEYFAQPLWECKDGIVGFTLMLGFSRARANKALVDWIKKDGLSAGVLDKADLEKVDWPNLTNEDVEAVFAGLKKFMKNHTKAELYEGAKKIGLQLVPSLTMKERLNFPQLLARNFWENVDYPELGTSITHPGPFLKFSETPISKSRRAPFIGEHNQEIYAEELGLSPAEIVALKQRRVI